MKILFICGHSAENVLVLNFLKLVNGLSCKGHQLTFWYLSIPYRISHIIERLTSDKKLITIYNLLPPNKLSFFIFDRWKRVSIIIYNDLLKILNIDVKKFWHQTSRYYEHNNILADIIPFQVLLPSRQTIKSYAHRTKYVGCSVYRKRSEY